MHRGSLAAVHPIESSTRFGRFPSLAVVALAGLLFCSVSRAAPVNHNADDGANFSGFNADTNWTPGGAPGPGNDYLVTNFLLRTPQVTGNFIFTGDSLQFIDGGRFYLMNGASTDLITTNNLILDAGEVRSNSQTTGGAISNLAGSIRVTSNGAIFTGSSATGNYMNIQANITNALASTGLVALGGNDSIGSAAINKKIILSGTNSYTGPTLLLGGNVQLASAGALSPSTVLFFGSANTANNNGSATLDLNGGNYSVAGIAVQSYTAQLNQGVVLPFPNPPGGNNRIFRLANPIVPGSIQIGQTVTDVLQPYAHQWYGTAFAHQRHDLGRDAGSGLDEQIVGGVVLSRCEFR